MKNIPWKWNILTWIRNGYLTQHCENISFRTYQPNVSFILWKLKHHWNSIYILNSYFDGGKGYLWFFSYVKRVKNSQITFSQCNIQMNKSNRDFFTTYYYLYYYYYCDLISLGIGTTTIPQNSNLNLGT